MPRALFVEDVAPRSAWGAGYPRSSAVVDALAAVCDEVLVCPMLDLELPDVPADPWPANVRIAPGYGVATLANALAGHRAGLDVLWVCRPHNLAEVHRLHESQRATFAGMRIVYDAEALFGLRTITERALTAEPMTDFQARRLLRKELQPAEIATHIAAVSERERAMIEAIVRRPVSLLRHPAPVAPTPGRFAARQGILFFGALRAGDSPNADSLRHFARDVLPLLAERGLRLDVAGAGGDSAGWLREIADPRMRVLGPVGDVANLFDRVRVVVAPTRYGAGIPLKVIEAARHGVPVVATPLVATQLGWRDGAELLVGDTPQRFAEACVRLHEDEELWLRVREGALAAIRRDFDPTVFRDMVRQIATGGAEVTAGSAAP